MRFDPSSGRAALLVLVLAAAGCGGAPRDGTIPEGRYRYRASHPIPGSRDSVRLEGVMRITVAAGDSLDGRWEVERMNPELEARRVGRGEVEVTGHPTYFGTLLHTVRPAAGGGLSCGGRYLWVAEGGVERSLPVDCTLSVERAGETDGAGG